MQLRGDEPGQVRVVFADRARVAEDIAQLVVDLGEVLLARMCVELSARDHHGDEVSAAELEERIAALVAAVVGPQDVAEGVTVGCEACALGSQRVHRVEATASSDQRGYLGRKILGEQHDRDDTDALPQQLRRDGHEELAAGIESHRAALGSTRGAVKFEDGWHLKCNPFAAATGPKSYDAELCVLAGVAQRGSRLPACADPDALAVTGS